MTNVGPHEGGPFVLFAEPADRRRASSAGKRRDLPSSGFSEQRRGLSRGNEPPRYSIEEFVADKAHCILAQRSSRVKTHTVYTLSRPLRESGILNDLAEHRPEGMREKGREREGNGPARKGPFVKTCTRALETKVSRRGTISPEGEKPYVGHRERCITTAPHAVHLGILVTGGRAPTAAAKLSLCHKVSRKKGWQSRGNAARGGHEESYG